MYTKL